MEVAANPAAVKDKLSMVVFSGDLDKLIAAFTIATGAAASGMEVTMFFTFWGINVLKKEKGRKGAPSFLGKMFDMMMPKNMNKVPLSKMNMGGLGPFFMKKMMKKKRVMSLPEYMQLAKDLGVKILACSMSMDVMDIPKEDLDYVDDFAGVAAFLAEAAESKITLFI